MTEGASGSNGVTRWILPLGIVWAGLLLSAWVYTERLPEAARAPSFKLGAVMFGAPAAALLGLLVMRGVTGRAGRRSGDLVVVWVMTFFFGVHAAVLAVVIGILGSLTRAIPPAIGVLLLGLAPVLGALEPGSPMGIRTRATLGDPAAWKKAHRFAAKMLAGAGTLAFAALLLPGIWVLYGAIGPAVIAVAWTVAYAARVRTDPKSAEDEAPAIRPTPGDS